jgi:hypothetical protein
MNYYEAIDRELARLHELRERYSTSGQDDKIIYEQMKQLQAALINESPPLPPAPINKFEVFCREWAKGCTVTQESTVSSGYPWDCTECSRAFMEAIWKLAREK